MHIYLRRALRTALLTGGLMVAGTAAAHAATDGLVGDIADDTAAVASVTAPVSVDGVAVSVLGDATTQSGDAAPAPAASDVTLTDTATDAPSTDGEGLVGDVAEDATVVAPVTAPVTVGCTSVAVGGDADAECAGAQTTPSPDVTVSDVSTEEGSADGAVVGDVLTDTDVVAPVTAPVTVDGVAVSVLGDASTQSDGAPAAATPGDVTVTDGTTPDDDALVGDVLTDTDVVAPVTAPVTVDGVAVSVLGDASTHSDGAPAAATPGDAAVTDGTTPDDGALVGDVLTDTDVVAPVTAPVTVDGVAVSVLGGAISDELAPAVPGAPAEPALPGDPAQPADADVSDDYGVMSSGITAGGRLGVGSGFAVGSGSFGAGAVGSAATAASAGATSAASLPTSSERDPLAETGVSATGAAGLAVLLLAGGAAAMSRRTHLV